MPGSGHTGESKELRDKVQSIILKYEEKLASVGVSLTVNKKYFETDVGERHHHYVHGIGLFEIVDRELDKKRERKYKNERNKYHCLVISVHPTDNNLVPKELCKDYAFLLRKVERAHIGQKPERITYEEDKVLAKIEKRISKIITVAEKYGAQKACTDTVSDMFRYFSSAKYEYKRTVLGKDRPSWDIIISVTLIIFLIVIVLICWIISKLL